MTYPLPVGTKPPWPYMTASKAGKELGVGWELMRGLVDAQKIRGLTVLTPKGNVQYVVSIEDVQALKRRMAEQ